MPVLWFQKYRRWNPILFFRLHVDIRSRFFNNFEQLHPYFPKLELEQKLLLLMSKEPLKSTAYIVYDSFIRRKFTMYCSSLEHYMVVKFVTNGIQFLITPSVSPLYPALLVFTPFVFLLVPSKIPRFLSLFNKHPSSTIYTVIWSISSFVHQKCYSW